MSDLLERMSRALAEENEGAVVAPEVTKRRVLESLGDARKRRRFPLAWGGPLVFALLGSTALAAAVSPEARQWVAGRLLDASSPTKEKAASKEIARPALGQPGKGALGGAELETPPEGSERPVAQVGESPGEAPPTDLFEPPSSNAAMPMKPAGAAAPKVEEGVTATTPVEAERGALAAERGALAAERGALAAERGALQAERGASDAEPSVDRCLPLYQNAHRLQFREKDCAGAVEGYRAYLKAAPAGAFVPEAEFNSALCLVRVGRVEAAKVLLGKFARGTYGEYRRVEAVELLRRLTEDASASP